MRPHSSTTKALALRLLEQGNSVRQTHTLTGMSIGSVQAIRKSNKENIPPHKPGPQPWVSERTKRRLARGYDTGHMTKPFEGQQFIQAADGIYVSESCVREYVQQHGLEGYLKQRSPQALS